MLVRSRVLVHTALAVGIGLAIPIPTVRFRKIRRK